MVVRQKITIYGRSNKCQFEHEGKQIKLLSLRPKTGQLKQTFILTLLPTPTSPTSPPLIATVSSLFFTNPAYYVHKSLPPLLPTPSHYKALEFAPTFASHKHVHKLHKEISDENK